MATLIGGSILTAEAIAGNDYSWDVTGLSLQEDDVLVFIGSYPSGGTPGALVPGTGGTPNTTNYTELVPTRPPHADGVHTAWAYLVPSSPPSSLSFTNISGTSVRDSSQILIALRGVDLAQVQVAAEVTTTGTTASTAHNGVTMPGAGALILWSSHGDDTGFTLAGVDYPGTSFDSGAVTFNPTNAIAHHMYAGVRVDQPSGATGTQTVNFTSNPNNKIAFTIGLPDVGGGGSEATATPGRGEIVTQGRAPSVNTFTNVRIREVLINEAGSPLANMTGLNLLVWYGGIPAGAPDLSYSALTTDANGSTSWSLATGTLQFNQPIFYVATDGSASLSAWTCGRIIPTYT